MTNQMFNSCVAILFSTAALTGMPYREINLIIFGILWPAATIWLVVVVWQQQKKILELERKCISGVIR